MQVWVLGSGSRGNAILLDAGPIRVLIDAGFGPRALSHRMRACGIAPESVCALVVTHEHHDHARGAAKAARKWGWDLYTSNGTARASRRLSSAKTFRAGDHLRIESLTISTIHVSHDAEEPIAILACDERSGVRATIAHDFGVANDALRRAMDRVDILVLESNHDEGMLRAGPYPPFLQDRIAGARGHLSNRAAGMLARQALLRDTRELVLAHISEHNNTPTIAYRAMAAALRNSSFRGRLTPAPQDTVAGPFGPAARPRARQLSLGL